MQEADLERRLRELPSVEQLLHAEPLRSAAAGKPRTLAVTAARRCVERRRSELLTAPAGNGAVDAAALAEAAAAELERLSSPSLRRVVNATGVVVHTNLGRAPLSEQALTAVERTGRSYANLEYDLDRGGRGSRHAHVEGLIAELTGAESGMAVNNNAAAVMLSLAALAHGREVVISRGQLVEIGGSFRIPDILAASGAQLVEVGTTNRTRLADYERAINDYTAALMRVHASNFRTVGFTQEAPLMDLATLAHERGLALIDDLGSGALVDATAGGEQLERLVSALTDEPSVRDSVAAGADVVCFSGDKLLGGPQAGLVAGTRVAVERLRSHPLARALRIDKLSLAALEVTLRQYRDPERAVKDVPVLRMLSASDEELERRAAAMRLEIDAARDVQAGVKLTRASGRVGGGALPLAELEGPVVSVRPKTASVDALQRSLRSHDPPVVARVSDGALLLDPRTMTDDEAALAAQAVVSALDIVPPAVVGPELDAPLTLGTAGHIDHGKTVLVETLTGINTDRLPEERDRGISIELGFAPLALPSGRSLSVVDVPGHERFVRTMVAGATGIDLFLLVVAADDGVMPQTREHLAVLRMLEVPAGVVALTKTDVVEPDQAELAAEEVRDLLGGGPYASSEVVSVCAPQGRGLSELTAAIDVLAARTPGRGAAGEDARLHVDRSFTLTGAGTVVTGTLWEGSIGSGEEIRIEPAGRTARVRTVHVHDRPRERAGPGQRVALNLAGIDRREVRRGDVITAASKRLAPSYLVDAAVELLPGARPLRRGARVHVHHGTRETPARLAPLDSEGLDPGTRGFVQLRLERPLVPAAGDRFVIRQIAPPDTIGGGVVLDPRPRKHGAGRQHVDRMRLLSSGDPLERLEALLAQAPAGVAADEADVALLDTLVQEQRARRAGGRPSSSEPARYFAAELLDRARRSLLDALSNAAARGPQSRGALADAAGVPQPAARAILDDLVAEKEVVVRGAGFLPAAEVAEVAEVDRADDRLLRSIESVLEADGLEPRGVEAVAEAAGVDAELVRRLLDRLVVEQRLVRVKPGLYYHPRPLAAAEHAVFERCRRSGSVTIAELRDDLGTSRKYSQALLEHMDGQRKTLRQGDRHVLRHRAEGFGV